jgi:hypothetical protein
LGGLRVGHRVFAKQTQEPFGSKKEIGILVSLLLGFLCLYCFLVFPKEKIRIFCCQEIGILFHFFFGCFCTIFFFWCQRKARIYGNGK